MLQALIIAALDWLATRFFGKRDPAPSVQQREDDMQRGADAATTKIQEQIAEKADAQAHEAVVDRGGAADVSARLHAKRAKARKP